MILGEGCTPPLVHCCTPSLCWLEAETGDRVGTPYMRQWNVWATAKAKFDGFCSIFLQKAHVTSISSVEFFLGGPKIIFTPSNGPFFRGTGTFPELRGPSQNWGAGLWEDPRRCCCCCCWKCQLIIEGPAHNWGSSPSFWETDWQRQRH